MVFALAIAPAAMLLLGQTYSGYLQELEAAEENLVAAAKVATIEHAKLITGAQKTLTTLASQDALRDLRYPACPRDLLTNLVSANPEFSAFALVGLDGAVMCSSAGADRFDFSGAPWLTRIIEGRERFALSELVDTPLTEGRAFIAAVPIASGSDEMKGALAVALNPLALIGATPFAELSADAFVVLVDSEGQMLDVALAPPRDLPDISPAEVLEMARTAPGSVVPAKSKVGEDLVMTVGPLQDAQLNVVFGLPAQNVFTFSRLKLFLSLASPLLIWLIAIVTAWIAADRLVIRWVIYLQRMANLYAAGRHSVRPRDLTQAPTEIRLLGSSLGRMIETIEQRDRELRNALDHRELLIREIHHRVKNNLQIITSLLNLHGRSATGARERAAMLSIQGRVNALAVVHRSLYEANDLEHVELKSFLTTLGSQLSQLLNAQGRTITLAVQVPPIVLPADTAITIAMLVTEAITNAFKYAFEGRTDGRILVRLEHDGPGAVLTIADDGVGYGSRAPRKTGRARRRPSRAGLGRSLMDGFASRIGGQITYGDEDGTTVRVTIPNLNATASESEDAPPSSDASPDMSESPLIEVSDAARGPRPTVEPTTS